MAGTKTSAIYLEGLPGYVSKQKLLIYFGNHTKSGGGEVNEEETVLNEDAGTATVVFDDEQGAARVLEREGHHIICIDFDGNEVEVELNVLPTPRPASPAQLENASKQPQNEERSTTNAQIDALIQDPVSRILLWQKLEQQRLIAGGNGEFERERPTYMPDTPVAKPMPHPHAQSSMYFTHTSPSDANMSGSYQICSPPRDSPQLTGPQASPSPMQMRSPLHLNQSPSRLQSQRHDLAGVHQNVWHGRQPQQRNSPIWPPNKWQDGMPSGQHHVSDPPPAYEDAAKQTGATLDNVIEVSELPENVHEDKIWLYFKNPRSRGGELIENECVYRQEKRRAIVVFKDSAAVEGVLSKQHQIEKHDVQVKKGKPRWPSSIDKRRILVQNLNPAKVTEEHLKLWLENQLKISTNEPAPSISFSDHKNAAIVTFACDKDILAVTKKVKERAGYRPLNGNIIEARPLQELKTVLLEGTEKISDEDIILFLENIAGDYTIDEVDRIPQTQEAVIYFVNSAAANEVLKEPRRTVFGQEVNVYPYYPTVNMVLSPRKIKTKVPDPVEFPVTASVLKAVKSKHKYKDMFEEAFVECNGKAAWRPSGLKVETTLTSSAPRLTLLTWADKTTAIFESVYNQFRSEQLKVDKDVLEDIENAISPLQNLECHVTVDVPNCIICLTGETSDVEKCSDMITCKIRELTETVTEPIDIQNWQHTFLTQSGFYDDLQTEFPLVKFNAASGTNGTVLKLNGPKLQVQEYKQQTFQKVLKLHQCACDVELSVLSFLKSADVRKFFENMFQQDNVSAIFLVEKDKVTVYASDESNANRAKSTIFDMVKSHTIPVADSAQQGWNTDAFCDLKRDLESDNQNRVQIEVIDAGAGKQIIVTALKDVFGGVRDQIEMFLKDNSIIAQEVTLGKGIVSYVKAHMTDTIHNIQTENKVVITAKNDKFIVRGTREKANDAAKGLFKEATGNVHSKEIHIQQPHITSFFNSQEGRAMVMCFEKEHACVIDVPLINDSEARRQMYGDKDDDNDDDNDEIDEDDESFSSTAQQKAVCEYNGVRITARFGNMVKQTTDVIVSAADVNLSQSAGGLAAALAKAGGQNIISECQTWIKTHGELFEGDIAVTSSGRLHCKYLIHAVGPSCAGNTVSSQDEVILISCVKKSLRECSNQNLKSISIPAISAGAHGFPVSSCCNLIVKAIFDYLKKHACKTGKFGLKEIHLVDQSAEVVGEFTTALFKQFGKDHIEYDWNEDEEGADGGAMSSLSSLQDYGAVSMVHTEEEEQMLPSASVRSFTKSELNTSKAGNVEIQLHSGAIQRQRVDVIVCSLNPSCDLSTGAASAALAKAAGKSLQKYITDKYKGQGERVQCGEVWETPPADLSCKKLYHVFCQPYSEGKLEAEKFIRSLTKLCLSMATRDKFKSIAFPAIGCGGLEIPPRIVAKAMYEEIRSFCSQNQNSTLQQIKIVVFEKDDQTISGFLNYLEGCSPSDNSAPVPVAGASPLPAGNAAQQDSEGVSGEVPLFKKIDSGNSKVVDISVGQTVLLRIQLGDITKIETECIVSPTNEALDLQTGGVSNSVLQNGGPVIEQELQRLAEMHGHPCEGDIIITGAGQLPVKKIFHAIHLDASKTNRVVYECLKQAENLHMSSISFPVLGAGIIGEECVPRAARDTMDAIGDFVLKETPECLQIIQIVVFHGQPDIFQTFVAEVTSHIQSGRKGTGGSFSFTKALRSGGKRVLQQLGFIGKDKVKESPAYTPPVKPSLKSQSRGQVPDQTPDQISVTIFSGSTDAALIAAKFFEDRVGKEFKYDKIENPIIRSLTHKAQKKILKLKKNSKVDILFDTDVGRIKLIGSEACRTKAKLKIQNILHAEEDAVRKADMIQKEWQWWYKDPTTEEFKCIEKTLNAQIESAYQNTPSGRHNLGKYRIEFVHKGRHEAQLTGLLVHPCQVVRRAVHTDIPVEWEIIRTARISDAQHVHIVPLENSSKEYKKMEQHFKQSIENACSEIVSIERIENIKLHSQYEAENREVEKNNKALKGKIERLLFHGTKGETCDKINRWGFDRSFCGNGSGLNVWGNGVYFALKSEYSSRDVYSPADDNGIKYVYIARVVVGDFTQGKEGEKHLPVKPDTDPPVKYDSFVDDVEQPEIFVIFKDAGAYPAYLVKFKE